MATNIIVSYDGTANDRDALELGRLLAGVGGSLALAYVRHSHEAEGGREELAALEAEALLASGADALGQPEIPQHVVFSASTPVGLRELAVAEGADLIVFGSEYRTAPGHVDPQPSAQRLLDGGPVAIAIAPAGFATAGDYRVATIAVIGEDGDPCPRETAEAIAAGLRSTIVAPREGEADLVVVGSKPGTVNGRVTISAAAEYVIDLTRCPVPVLPRGVALLFGRSGG
ncbi:MAG TPA: universal stress protein [Gaiellales bacterium]|nr:universal stress protein [Gaiellales bacterium]